MSDRSIARARSHALGDLITRSAARTPGQLAVVDGDRRQTFAEFNDSVNRLASSLSTRGVVHGTRVALLSRNCWEFATLTFALAKLGAVLVPVNFMLSAAEVAFILQHSGAEGVVTQQALLPVATEAIELAGLNAGLRGWIGDDRSPGEEITLVALTPCGGEIDEPRLRGAGFDHHLPKPIDAEDLITLIGRVPPSTGSGPE